MIPSERRGTWRDDYPDLAKALGDKQGTATVLKAPDGERVAAAIVTAPLVGGLRAGVIETEAFDRIMAPAIAMQNTSLLVALIAADRRRAVVGAAVALARANRSCRSPPRWQASPGPDGSNCRRG